MEGETARKRREGEEEGREGDGKGFAGPLSNYFLYAPVSDCMGRAYYLFVCTSTC